MPGDGVLVVARPAHRVEIRDLPDRGLPAVATPTAGAPHGVPRRFMPPVVVAPAEREMLLVPDDLAAQCEAGGLERLGDDRPFQRGVPDVGDHARKQSPRRRPVGSVIIQHGPAGSVTPSTRKASPARMTR
jgi:hypothetical protein